MHKDNRGKCNCILQSNPIQNCSNWTRHRVLIRENGLVVKQFIPCGAGVTDINGKLRHCSRECITVEAAVRSWVAASVKNGLQLE